HHHRRVPVHLLHQRLADGFEKCDFASRCVKRRAFSVSVGCFFRGSHQRRPFRPAATIAGFIGLGEFFAGAALLFVLPPFEFAARFLTPFPFPADPFPVSSAPGVSTSIVSAAASRASYLAAGLASNPP